MGACAPADAGASTETDGGATPDGCAIGAILGVPLGSSRSGNWTLPCAGPPVAASIVSSTVSPMIDVTRTDAGNTTGVPELRTK